MARSGPDQQSNRQGSTGMIGLILYRVKPWPYWEYLRHQTVLLCRQ
jgi:hypothetical protein